jgi:peptide chain release factor 2
LPFGTLFDFPAKQKSLADLEIRMGAPNFWDDQESAQKTVQQLKKVRSVVEPMTSALKSADDLKTLLELLDEQDDAALREELDEGLTELTQTVSHVEMLTLLSGPNDSRDCYFGIQAGTGGADAQDWASMMMRMYLRFFERNGYQVEEVSMREGEEAGIQSVNWIVRGPFAYGYLVCEMGVHRMERISPFNAQGKRQTSFAAVDVTPELDDIAIEIDWDKDVREDTYRAGGKGGQHVNKTDSAVRLTHLATNLVSQCQSERSQHKNRAQARKMLMSRLYQQEESKRDAELAKAYGEKGQIGWGYRILTYTLQPYQLVKDERTAHKTPDVDGVLDGDLMPFIEAELRRRLAKSKSH